MIGRAILSELKNVRRTNAGWTARCPAHNDEHPSLSIKEVDEGKLLLKCHAGCSFEQIKAALYPNGQHGDSRIIKTYDYVDENRQLLYQVCRTEPKGFFMRRPNDKGEFINSLGDVRRVLYRLPEVLSSDPSSMIYIVEGEKDVETLGEHGLVATCNVGGAGKWREEYNEHLRGRHVCILPDHDQPGMEHALKVAQSLHGIAASVRIVDLFNIDNKESLK